MTDRPYTYNHNIGAVLHGDATFVTATETVGQMIADALNRCHKLDAIDKERSGTSTQESYLKILMKMGVPHGESVKEFADNMAKVWIGMLLASEVPESLTLSFDVKDLERNFEVTLRWKDKE